MLACAEPAHELGGGFQRDLLARPPEGTIPDDATTWSRGELLLQPDQGSFYDLELPLGGDLDRSTGLGVAAHTRVALADAKASEAAELDGLGALQRLRELVQYRVYDRLALLLGELRRPGHYVNKVRLIHQGSKATFQSLLASLIRLSRTDTGSQ